MNEMPNLRSTISAMVLAGMLMTSMGINDARGAIDAKRAQISQMSWFLDVKHQDHANADGKMTDEQKKEYLKKFEADLISPADLALWNRGASNAVYHYLGCAKTFALMGKHFAETNLRMMKKP